MLTNRINGLARSAILVLACIIVLSIVSVAPSSAYNETLFTTVEESTYNDLVYNETLTIDYPNGTAAYMLDYRIPVVRTIPLGTDIDFQIKIVCMVCLLVIACIMLIRAAYDLASWVMSKKV